MHRPAGDLMVRGCAEDESIDHVPVLPGLRAGTQGTVPRKMPASACVLSQNLPTSRFQSPIKASTGEDAPAGIWPGRMREI